MILYNWAKKYNRFLRLTKIGEELSTPVKQKDMKSFLQGIVDELPESDEELSEKDLSESGLSYFSIKFFDTLKEYYILFASIPLFFGGSIQIISLMAVGKNYLRFFSTTQLLTDGLIVLLYIFIFLAGTFIIISFMWVFKQGKAAALGMTFVFLFLSIKTIVEDWHSIRQFNFDANTESALWLLAIILFGNLIYWVKRPLYISTISYVGLFIIGFYLLFVSVTFGIFSFIENFSFGDMRNQKNLECVLKQDNISFTDFKVIYNNDKYIFVKLNNGNEKEIVVLPFEALFDGTACKSVE